MDTPTGNSACSLGVAHSTYPTVLSALFSGEFYCQARAICSLQEGSCVSYGNHARKVQFDLRPARAMWTLSNNEREYGDLSYAAVFVSLMAHGETIDASSSGQWPAFRFAVTVGCWHHHKSNQCTGSCDHQNDIRMTHSVT